MNNSFLDIIKNINPNIVKLNVSSKPYNTLKIDVNIKVLILPRTIYELKEVLKVFKEHKINYFLIGHGSNIVLSEREKDCVIKLDFRKRKNTSFFYSNEMLSTVGQLFLYNNLTGMEKLFCIPGTLGGAIFMNAGAHGSTIKDIVDRVYYLDENLKVKSLSVKDCKFSYRSSIFKEKNYIILGCKFIKKTKKKEDIKNEMIIWQTYRKFNQNILYPNCGSVFKNGRNFKAWELIDKCNFDNLMVGGAKLSDTHKNFIVNYNNASGRDVITLISIIKEHVLSKFNIKLEEEIIIFD